MKLVEAHVRKFRNIIDSTPVEIKSDVTCLVGKNESGKTTFLEALYRLKPARNPVFSVRDQYPAWLEKRDRQAGEDLDAFCPIEATFDLEADDLLALAERFGVGTITSRVLTAQRTYADKLSLAFDIEESCAVRHIVERAALTGEIAEQAAAADNLEALDSVISGLGELSGEDEAAASSAAALKESRDGVLGDKSVYGAVREALCSRLPTFFYFPSYSTLPGVVKIREILGANKDSLSDDHRTARSLLDLGGTEDEYMLNPDYEVRKRELENIANAITADVLDYWTQNRGLRALIDITQRTEPASSGQTTVLDELRVRVWDDEHLLSLPFDEHSTGFRWFFSFLAAFSEFGSNNERVVILLDEPALGLHARAQDDFLRFINERLAPKHQVVYTTHSPFMIEPSRLERVRVVEDLGRAVGATVSSDVLSTDPDTLFPLQGALGYELVQHLFIAPNNLVIEGTSDFTYLSVMSEHLVNQGRSGLDPRWSLVPVGGADLIPTFVALLGIHVDLTVLVDVRKPGNQRLANLVAKGLLAETRIVTVGEAVGRKEADIEDVFVVEDYLRLYNEAFNTDLKSADLTGTERIVRRIERHTDSEFDHGKPADVLLRRRDEILPTLASDSLDRFESLFERTNETLPPAEP